MRLGSIAFFCWRLAAAIGCIVLGAICCANVPLPPPGAADTTNASLWATVTTAALATLYLKQSNK
jgi:hypothetical protein